MEGESPAELIQNALGGENPTTPSKPRVGASTNDQRFLLVFILGTYFGPDVRNEIPRLSAFQREAKGLPPYTSESLGGSVCKLSEIESVYYYLLRKSDPSAKVKLQSLYKFLQGHLAPPVKEPLEDGRQFPNFFPPQLHRHSRYKGTYKVVENIVFIDSPVLPEDKTEDVERFIRLSGLSTVAVDRDEAKGYQHGLRADRDDDSKRQDATQDASTHAGSGINLDGSTGRKKRKKKVMVEMPPTAREITTPKLELAPDTPNSMMGPAMMLLPSFLTGEQWESVISAAKPSIVFTGSAAARQAGPLIGLVDIGVSDDAYLFRTALPGVKKDGDGRKQQVASSSRLDHTALRNWSSWPPSVGRDDNDPGDLLFKTSVPRYASQNLVLYVTDDFKCEVEGDGKVTIRGSTTTGENRVVKDQRVFTMRTHYLCPPGPFTVSFSLPGPVEPSQFTGTFGSDGILEGIVMKQRATTGAASLTFEP